MNGGKKLLFAFYLTGLSAFCVSPHAFAVSRKEVSRYCISAEVLQSRVPDCSSNYFVMEASESCLKGLLQRIEAEKSNLAIALQKQAAVERSGQVGNLENANADVAQARATLDNLIKEATLVRDEQTRYLDVIAFPGTGRAMSRYRGMEAVDSQFFCVTNAKEAVTMDIADVNKKIDELKSGNQAATSLQDRGLDSVGKLDEIITGSSIVGKGHGERGVKSGLSHGEASDVTGVQHEESLKSMLGGEVASRLRPTEDNPSEVSSGSGNAARGIDTSGESLGYAPRSGYESVRHGDSAGIAVTAEIFHQMNADEGIARSAEQNFPLASEKSGERRDPASAQASASSPSNAQGGMAGVPPPSSFSEAGVPGEKSDISLFHRVHKAYERNVSDHKF